MFIFNTIRPNFTPPALQTEGAKVLKELQAEEALVKEKAQAAAQEAIASAQSGNLNSAKKSLAQAQSFGVEVPGLLTAEGVITVKEQELADLQKAAKEKVLEEQKLADQQAAAKSDGKAEVAKKGKAGEAAQVAAAATAKTDEELKKEKAAEAKREQEAQGAQQQAIFAQIAPPPLGGTPEEQQAQAVYNLMAGVVLNKLKNPLPGIGLDVESKPKARASGAMTASEEARINATENSPQYAIGAERVKDDLIKQLVMNGVPARELVIPERSEIERLGEAGPKSIGVNVNVG